MHFLSTQRDPTAWDHTKNLQFCLLFKNEIHVILRKNGRYQILRNWNSGKNIKDFDIFTQAVFYNTFCNKYCCIKLDKNAQ